MSKTGPAAPLLPVAEARKRILAAAARRARPSETVPVAEADGRVLAADLAALRSQPPADISAMDGFALRAADARPGRPLRIIGESAAGHPFAGAIGPAETVRIFTGAVLPEGADAVLIQENGRILGETLDPLADVTPGLFVRRAGRDFPAGAVLLRAGRRLDPGSIALAGAMNHAAVPVFAKPRIAILATGDELVRPGEIARPDAIVATNSYAVAALCRHAGAITRDLGIAADSHASLAQAFAAARDWQADCLVTIGGASVGKHDLVRAEAAEQGARLDFYKIAMRPGKPLNFGAIGPMLIVGLPGNPVSSLVCARLFLVPLVRALQGDSNADAEDIEPARLGAALPANDEREDYLRATLARAADGALIASALGDQDSSLLSVYAAAQALVIRPPFAPPAAIGEACSILRL